MNSLMPLADTGDMIENRTFDEIAVGDSAELSRTLTREDIELFATTSGDVNPAHLDDAYADGERFHHIIGHGMWSGSLISAVLGTKLPGPGTIYMEQSLRFRRPVSIGDTITARVTVTEKQDEKKRLSLECVCLNQDGDTITEGKALVLAPTERVCRPRVVLPHVTLSSPGRKLNRLMEQARALSPIPTAVVHPVDADSIEGALDAAAAGLIDPVLIGPEARIRAAAQQCGRDLAAARIVDAEHSHAAAAKAVELCRTGETGALMKGAIHTDEVMEAAVAAAGGLRTERRASHVFVIDVPDIDRLLFVTDAAINIDPDLRAKHDIVQNAIELAHALGVDSPKVALISAVETINPRMVSTLDAATLCKMADRGQITGGVLDGPLAFDNAMSEEAARVKAIRSPVAGHADILVAPELVSGNLLAKQLMRGQGAMGAGLVLGLRVPIMLTSRADGPATRLASAAIALLAAAHRS